MPVSAALRQKQSFPLIGFLARFTGSENVRLSVKTGSGSRIVKPALLTWNGHSH
jgi:hypothetical protein